MFSAYHSESMNLGSPSWALTEDQQHLCDAVHRFARRRLTPMLTQFTASEHWDETVRLSGEFDLGNMILPAHQGGLAIDHADLYLVVEQFAAGPLERAAELTLSAPALMTLREHDALECLPTREIRDYFNGSASVSLVIPGNGIGRAWILQRHPDAPLLLLRDSADGHVLVLVAAHELGRVIQDRIHIATLQALRLEQVTFDSTALESCAQITCGTDVVQTWLAETGFYLCALLVGTMQQSVTFAFEHATTRHAFRKTLASHQLVATRLADMLIAAQGAQLFLRAVAAHGTSASASASASASDMLIRQLLRHVAAEAMDVSRELVQICGGHGYVEGLPPAAHFQTIPRFALLLLHTEAAMGQWTSPRPTLGGAPS
jgi:alkylation response protein AidB-like acyl-CoA dehydrogenase